MLINKWGFRLFVILSISIIIFLFLKNLKPTENPLLGKWKIVVPKERMKEYSNEFGVDLTTLMYNFINDTSVESVVKISEQWSKINYTYKVNRMMLTLFMQQAILSRFNIRFENGELFMSNYTDGKKEEFQFRKINDSEYDTIADSIDTHSYNPLTSDTTGAYSLDSTNINDSVQPSRNKIINDFKPEQ